MQIHVICCKHRTICSDNIVIEQSFLEVLSFFSSPSGGSHYLLLDEISHNLHQQGHEVRMLLQLGNPVITGKLYIQYTQTYIFRKIFRTTLSLTFL